MAFKHKLVSLGPYTPKQKLYLETEDGEAMEGEFVKFNTAQTTILLHKVELIPSDGRIFDQYNAILSELVCLRPLEDSKVAVSPASSSVAEETKPVADKPNGIVQPESNNSLESRQLKVERIAAQRKALLQQLDERGLMNDIHPDVLKQLSAPAATLRARPATDKPVNKFERPLRTEEKRDVGTKPSKSPQQEAQPVLSGVDESTIEPSVRNGIYETLKSKAKGYIILDKPGPSVGEAMNDIAKRHIIGLGCHGAERGRLDRLSLLTVATESSVYIIDVQALGKQALQNPLIQALESSSVEKVTFDCRYLSDCLYYSHNVRLQNVYDVQAADCVLHRCRRGNFPNRGRGLQEIVSQYLNLPAALLADKTNITNYKVWYQRPLQDHCYDFASWQVVSLPQLRAAMDKTFQNLMQNSFDVYLTHIRKMKRADAVESLASRRAIPTDLLSPPFTRDA